MQGVGVGGYLNFRVRRLLLAGLMISGNSIFAKVVPKTQMKLRKNDADSELPKVIRIERSTPVFKAPSSKSKILADVDAGTTLIARNLSPKSSWLLVEDEDGNKGWIPLNRSNYRSLSPPAETVSDEEINEALEGEKQTIEPRSPRDTIVSVESLVSTKGFGGDVSILLLQTPTSPFSRERRIGLQMGAYREWVLKESQLRDWSFPVLVRLTARNAGSSLASGPDIGALYRRRDRSWGGVLGYSLGFGSGSSNSFQTRVRASVEWGAKTRYILNWSNGWIF